MAPLAFSYKQVVAIIFYLNIYLKFFFFVQTIGHNRELDTPAAQTTEWAGHLDISDVESARQFGPLDTDGKIARQSGQ